MTHHVLLVFPDADQSELLKEVLTESFDAAGLPAVIGLERNKSMALRRFRLEPADLIITHLHIAEDARTPLSEEDQLGLALLRQVGERDSQIPSILVSPFLNQDILGAVNKLPRCRLFQEGDPTWQDRIVESAGQELLHNPPPATKKINLEFFVDLDRDEWHMVCSGDGIICDETPIPINVDIEEIKKLIDWGKRVEMLKEYWPDWEEQLQDIGEVLVKQIFHNNRAVDNTFAALKEKVGGIENFSIRFHVDKAIHPLILEAILDPDYEDKNEYWMLKAPICRRISVRQQSNMPLYEDEETRSGRSKINCLVIESDVGDAYVEEVDVALLPLENVSREVEWLLNELQENRDDYAIGRIEHVPKAECSKKRLEALLTGAEQWHLVHFAGHSYYDQKHGGGYVFFPGQEQVEALSIDMFSQWLRQAKTRFVYMSSCHSSNEDFVYKLVTNQVPSTVGYRWDIDDDKAADHAEIFYSSLFRERSLEKAFLKTFQEMRQRYKEHIIWAAPLLVMQARHR
jgi:hypothetical protein